MRARPPSLRPEYSRLNAVTNAVGLLLRLPLEEFNSKLLIVIRLISRLSDACASSYVTRMVRGIDKLLCYRDGGFEVWPGWVDVVTCDQLSPSSNRIIRLPRAVCAARLIGFHAMTVRGEGISRFCILLGEVSQKMDQAGIYERLTQVFHDVFDDDSIQVTPQLTAEDVDGWDSLTHIRLLLTIEKAFGVKFSTLEIGKLQKVGDLVDLIRARL